MPTIDKKRPFPNTEDWDDFLDFSRMSVPANSVLVKRLVQSSLLFSGNYVWIWAMLTSIWGLFVNWRILASFTATAIVWFAAQVLCHDQELPQGPQKDPSLSKAWLMIITLIFVYEFSVMKELVSTSLAAMLIAALHAISRPIVNEYYFLNRPQPQQRASVTVASDGFIDEEESVIFTNRKSLIRNNSSLRSRKSQVSSQSQHQPIL